MKFPQKKETAASKIQRRQQEHERRDSYQADFERRIEANQERRRATKAKAEAEASKAPPSPKPQSPRHENTYFYKTKTEESKPHGKSTQAKKKARSRARKAAKREEVEKEGANPQWGYLPSSHHTVIPQTKLPARKPFPSWSAQCTSFFAEKPLPPTVPFPNPPRPLVSCNKSKCLYSEVLRCCHHEMRRIFVLAVGKECTPDSLKKERVGWHPDRFSGVVEGRREDVQMRAKEVFQLVQRLIDDES